MSIKYRVITAHTQKTVIFIANDMITYMKIKENTFYYR